MIRSRKYVDRAGNVSYFMEQDHHSIRYILRFTAKQYRDDRSIVARAIIRVRNQLKVENQPRRLTEAEVLKEFGR